MSETTNEPRSNEPGPNEPRRDTEGRPEPVLAVGHVEIAASDVGKTSAFLEQLGLLTIVVRDEFAVLEVRGGTHIVVKRAEQPIAPGSGPSFDLMVDDLDAAREHALALGAQPTPIRAGRVHSSFTLVDPSGQRIDIVSSHTVWRPA
jgi:4-hydroxyphenylpyruvate dioxygenase-like putative hemolysin